jgi:hypothetical protein
MLLLYPNCFLHILEAGADSVASLMRSVWKQAGGASDAGATVRVVAFTEDCPARIFGRWSPHQLLKLFEQQQQQGASAVAVDKPLGQCAALWQAACAAGARQHFARRDLVLSLTMPLTPFENRPASLQIQAGDGMSAERKKRSMTKAVKLKDRDKAAAKAKVQAILSEKDKATVKASDAAFAAKTASAPAVDLMD